MINKILKYVVILLVFGILIFFYLTGREELFSSNKSTVTLINKINWDKLNLPLIPVSLGTRDPQINTASYVLIDQDSANILAEKESNRKVAIASTTKIMSAMIILENLNLEDEITIPKEINSVSGSEINLKTGEKIKTNSLLEGLLMQSGNDCAFALAYGVGQKAGKSTYDEAISYFVELMNKKANDLNLANTTYADPAGLENTSQSTASDLAHLAAFAMKNSVFSQIITQKEKDIYSTDGSIAHHLKNSNRLLHENDIYYPYAIGIKTGFTNEAGHCLVGAAKKNNHILISVVLNTFDSTLTASAIESRKLLGWGFDNFEWK